MSKILVGIGKLFCCLLLLSVTSIGSILTFAYLSGDSADRVAMETALILRLHGLKFKTDRDLHSWMKQKHGETAKAQVLASVAHYAIQNPGWFKSFVSTLDASERSRLFAGITSSLLDASDLSLFQQLFALAKSSEAYRVGSR